MSSELLVSRAGSLTVAARRADGAPVALRVEDALDPVRVGRVHKARVTRVLPGLGSAFVDIGTDRDAYVHVSDLAPGAASVAEGIERRLRGGDEILVQVEREGTDTKGPRVTGRVTLPGRRVVFLPRSDHRGVSRRIEDPDERERLRALAAGFEGAGGFVVRSAAVGAAGETLRAEAAALVEAWSQVRRRAAACAAPALIRDELDLPLRMLRDGPGGGFDRVVVDDSDIFERARSLLRSWDPALEDRVVLHGGPRPLLDAYALAPQIRRILRPRVWLRSGGYLVIESTEALVSIDVNTGKHTAGRTTRDTILRTNLEAAREAARQLGLRGLGGLVVIDFVDLDRPEDRDAVLDALRHCLARDRARWRIEGMSGLGLVQLVRSRSRRPPSARLTRACPACGGHGRVKSAKAVLLEVVGVLRGILADPGAGATVRVHPDVAREMALVLDGTTPGIDGSARDRVRVEPDASLPHDRFRVAADPAPP